MTQRQHDTKVALRRAIAVSGADSDETRRAAIEVCYAHNIDPHFRYAIWPDWTMPPKQDWDKPVSGAVNSEAEWERVVRRFQTDTRT
jgi:hypothetical protein